MKHHIVRIFLSILWGSVVTISASTFAEEGTKLTISPDNCDIVFYCQTTQIIDILPDGSATARNNEAFSIALKAGELKIPQRQTVLGDGTLNGTLHTRAAQVRHTRRYQTISMRSSPTQDSYDF